MSSSDPARATGSRRSARIGSAAFLVTVAVIASLVAAFVVSLSVTDALAALGIPDPGVLTRYGLPAVRAGGEVAAVVSVGSLLLAAFLLPPQPNGVLDVDGYRALQIAGTAALIWAVCAALLIPLTGSDTTGQPLTTALEPRNVWKTVELVEIAGAWAWTAGLATLLAVACRLVLRWSWTPLLLGLALTSLMPLAINGHSSAGGSHDLATNSLILHLVAAALWAGGLLAVFTHIRRGGAHTVLAVRRFSTLATVAFAVETSHEDVSALTLGFPISVSEISHRMSVEVTHGDGSAVRLRASAN